VTYILLSSLSSTKYQRQWQSSLIEEKQRGIITMIEVKYEEDVTVTISGKDMEILDLSDDYVMVQCELEDLADEPANKFPEKLTLEINSSDGFDTNFFYELFISREDSRVALDFQFNMPNKFWEGQFGLATFINAIRDQATHFDNLQVKEFEVDDDWKSITLRHLVEEGELLHKSIISVANDLKLLLHTAEVALKGLQWKPEYSIDEDLFCRELLDPLLRRMGFLFVRYTHGKKEYGKDFTFSEPTRFGTHRHYGLQAKAGDVSGEVNSEVDELLGQIKDAFEMPYYELGSKDPHYISTLYYCYQQLFYRERP